MYSGMATGSDATTIPVTTMLPKTSVADGCCSCRGDSHVVGFDADERPSVAAVSGGGDD
jgi:hypothetical protein